MSRSPVRVLTTLTLTALALTALALAAATFPAGCTRAVTYGPAGEPAGSRQPTWLRFTIATDPAQVAAAQAFAAELSRIGVRAGVDVVARGGAARRSLAGELDSVLLGFTLLTPDSLTLSGKLAPGGAENYSRYDNPELGRLLAGLLTRPTASEREVSARAAQEFLHEDAPWLFGVCLPLYDAASESLTGWHSGPAGRVALAAARLSVAETPAASTGTTAGPSRLLVGLGLSERPALDPFGPADPQTGVILECIFDSLAAVAPDGSLVPEIAASWEFSTNARRLTVRLRDEVRFHNGQRLRPADVVLSYEKALAGRLPGPVTVQVAAGQDGTVVFRFSSPFPTFLDLFGLVPVVQADYYASSGSEAFAAAPVGTGPFRLKSDQSDRQLILTRWDGYYGDAPPIPEIAFLCVPDPVKRVTMLQNGQIHLAPALTPGAVAPLRDQAAFSVLREPGWTVLAVELNTSRPPFSDARVRLALNLVLDRPALALALGPEATPLPSAFLPESLGFSAEAGSFATDLAAARALLREAGFLVTPGP